jgi:hypothetical protein
MTAEDFYNFHRSQFDWWEHGGIKKAWTDTDGNTASCTSQANGGIIRIKTAK